MSIKDCTRIEDLMVLENQREFEHGQTLAPIGRRVVHVTHMDGTTETDLDWLARQYEMDDYLQTVHGASVYGQGA